MRLHAARYFAGLLWLHVPLVAIVARADGMPAVKITLMMAAAAALGTIAALGWGGNVKGRCTIAAALTVAPMLLVYAGHGPWQIDWHMYFFVIFGMLVAFVDWRPIVISAVLTAAHHFLLSAVFYEAVFPETGSARAVLHAAIVIADCIVLLWIVRHMKSLFANSHASLRIAEEALGRAQLLESVVVRANDAVIISDTIRATAGAPGIHGHVVVYVNDAFTSLTGLTGNAVIGKPLGSLEGQLPAELTSCFDASFDGDRAKRTGLWHAPDGHVVDVEASMVGIEGRKDGVLRTITFVRDLTEARRAGEAEMRAELAEEVNATLRREIGERESAENRLAFAAFHDDLTHLANRAYFRTRLSAALAVDGNVQPAGVLFLDLDRFKLVNDGLGHIVGDELLVAVAARLKETLREEDVLARLGGDEFIVLVEHPADAEELETIAKRLLASFALPFEVAGREMYATASIGIAYGRHLPGDEADDVLRNADLAMYRAKSLGKGRYELFVPELLERSTRLLQLETELRRGLDRSQLTVFFQPIVELDHRRVCGFEALVRWFHPEAGSIAPTEFISVAEDTGIIVELGHFVLEFACTQLRLWLDTFPSSPELWVSVNVSPVQLREASYVETVAATLAKHRVPPTLIHLEITESTIVSDLASIGPALSALRALGIGISIDDFGTGFSSLEYLDKLPVDVLKIDRSFVSGRGDGIANLKIVRTIVNLAKDLELGVVAEGIETSAQAETLRVLSRRAYGQGFFFSRPLDSHAAFELVGERFRSLAQKEDGAAFRLGA